MSSTSLGTVNQSDGGIATWPHRYDDLGDNGLMRYFQLWPGEAQDDLLVSLCTTPTLDAPPYKAISYVWGVTDKLEAISLMEPDNWNGLGILYVTPNLCAALRHIRKLDQEVLLWADAICINQESTTERSRQVKQMPTIYGNATEVLAWLGPDPWNRAKKAFSLLQSTAYREPDKTILKSQDFVERDDYLSAWSWVASQQWFKRVWTTQELGLSSSATIICGESRISWSDFHEVHRFLADSVSGDELRFWKVQHSLIAFLYEWKSSHGLSFLDAVANTQHRETSDARDRIYALLGHPSAATVKDQHTAGRLVVDVDYQKTIAEVYTEAAIAMIRQTSTLDVLSHVRSPLTRCQGLPTWVPDWRQKPNTMHTILTKQSFACGAPGGLMQNTAPSFSSLGQLKTTGIFCGKVIWHCQASAPELNRNMSMFVDSTDDLPIDSRFWDLPKDSIYWHKSWGQGTPLERVRRLGVMVQMNVDWQQNALPDPNTTGVPDPATRIKLLEELCVARSLFLTDTGVIGLGPEELEEGDELVVLNSGRVPFLLRSTQDQRYTLVGECCADGMMKGEAVTDPKATVREVVMI